MRFLVHQYPLILSILVLSFVLQSKCNDYEEANACVDVLPDDLCEFAAESDDWCETDPEFLKGKCDYSCGWCSESKDCVDLATYIDCEKLLKAECNKNPEFYLSRCRKSCNWCEKEPDGAWRQWTQWTPCTTTCGPGFVSRTRNCLTKNCRGRSHEATGCEVKKCPSWDDWSQWSKCSVTCEKGIRTRKRTCPVQGECGGSRSDTEECILPSCTNVPFDEWTPCSRSCDGGTRLFVFSCSKHDINKCPRKYEDCNTHRCPFKVCTSYRYGSKSSACCGDASLRVIGGKISTAKQWPWMVRSRRSLNQVIQPREFATLALVGGHVSMPSRFQWMARLEYVENPSRRSEGIHLCGGTLIHPRFVLTAAHCFEVPGVTAKTSQIVLGSISRADSSTLIQQIRVAKVTIHPNYSEPNHDMALVRLQHRAALTDYVQTLCLPEGEVTPPDTKCHVAGWGKTHFELSDAAPNLMEARIRYLPFGPCKYAYKNTRYGPFMEDESMVCAGKLAGNVDTCSGDSGGPLMCQRCDSCEWYLAGVTSFGSYRCGSVNIPGVYMKVKYYEKWIVDLVEKYERKGSLICKKNNRAC